MVTKEQLEEAKKQKDDAEKVIERYKEEHTKYVIVNTTEGLEKAKLYFDTYDEARDKIVEIHRGFCDDIMSGKDGLDERSTCTIAYDYSLWVRLIWQDGRYSDKETFIIGKEVYIDETDTK